MRNQSLFYGIGIVLLAQLGSTMTACAGNSGGPGSAGAGSGGEEASGGSVAGAPNMGGSAGAASGGRGVGGSRPKGPELCGISIRECKDGVVRAWVGVNCNPVTIECPGDCRDSAQPTAGPFSMPTYAEVEEAVCEPLNLGGAAGSGSAR